MRNSTTPFKVEKQAQGRDCGPTCLRMIASYYGIDVPLDHFYKTYEISNEGVSILDLANMAKDIGLRTLCIKIDLTYLYKRINLPCVVHWNNNHFIVVYKVTHKIVDVADPAKGLLSYSHKDFIKNWCNIKDKKGIALIFEFEG